MGEEKRKPAAVEEETENPCKSPRLDVAAAEAPLELSYSPSTEEGEGTTGDSIYDIGSCEHLFKDSEELDEIVCDLKAADKPPTCEHDPCRTTWSGPGGMMLCTECLCTFCTGEKGDRENPQGHARWHATTYEHWVALWCDEPSKGYCFECGRLLMLGQNKVNEDDYAVVPRDKKDEWGMEASNSKDDWAMMSRNVKVDLAALDQWRMVGSNAMDHWGMVGSNAMGNCGMVAGDDHVIRGIPNLGNTCYMNASLQCLLVLGKLRAMILRPDALLGEIGLHLKQLFVETSSVNNAKHMLDPKMILVYMQSLYPERFEDGKMEDSHDFLTSLNNALNNEVEQQNKLHMMQGGAVFPTFGNSIFTGWLLQTISCKSCPYNSVTHQPFDSLALALPSKDPPARSVDPGSESGDETIEKTPKPLQAHSTEVKDVVQSRLQTQKNDVPREIIEVTVKYLDFIPSLFDDIEGVEESTADSHNPEDKDKSQSSDIVHDDAEYMNSLGSIEDCLTLFSHQLTDKNCENCSKLAEVLETNGSKTVEPIMASTNVNITVDGDQTELSDRKTCPSERSSDFSSLSVESPSRQPYRSDSHHQVILSEDITTEEITSGKSCGEKDLASCSTANEKAESHEGAAPSCVTTDEQTDLLSAQDIRDTSTQKQGSEKQVMYDHSAQQVVEKQNKRTDGNGGASQTQLISKLPAVLTIQLKRYASDLSKLSGNVSFKEILHLGPFMDPSSEDKDKSTYRLVGVIEHRGFHLNRGHYIAYVRAGGGKQQGSGSSSWVCANDSIIRRVSLEEVLRCEAYILFYERIDD